MPSPAAFSARRDGIGGAYRGNPASARYRCTLCVSTLSPPSGHTSQKSYAVLRRLPSRCNCVTVPSQLAAPASTGTHRPKNYIEKNQSYSISTCLWILSSYRLSFLPNLLNLQAFALFFHRFCSPAASQPLPFHAWLQIRSQSTEGRPSGCENQPVLSLCFASLCHPPAAAATYPPPAPALLRRFFVRMAGTLCERAPADGPTLTFCDPITPCNRRCCCS